MCVREREQKKEIVIEPCWRGWPGMNRRVEMRADLRGCGFDLIAEKVERGCTDDLVCKQRGNLFIGFARVRAHAELGWVDWSVNENNSRMI